MSLRCSVSRVRPIGYSYTLINIWNWVRVKLGSGLRLGLRSDSGWGEVKITVEATSQLSRHYLKLKKTKTNWYYYFLNLLSLCYVTSASYSLRQNIPSHLAPQVYEAPC